MKQLIIFFFLVLTGMQVQAQEASSIENGKKVFDRWCIYCHGESALGPLPGTASLQIKYNGQIPALLEERNDLAPEYIRVVVRNGLYGMPITRQVEVSDADLEDIIAYLTRNNR
jgi:mono/diheme cytochrome c family protein